MKNKILQFISLIISSLALLYLLFVNVYRNSFIFSDWVVVSVDLFAKLIIELIMMFGKNCFLIASDFFINLNKWLENLTGYTLKISWISFFWFSGTIIPAKFSNASIV